MMPVEDLDLLSFRRRQNRYIDVQAQYMLNDINMLQSFDSDVT